MLLVAEAVLYESHQLELSLAVETALKGNYQLVSLPVVETVLVLAGNHPPDLLLAVELQQGEKCQTKELFGPALFSQRVK